MLFFVWWKQIIVCIFTKTNTNIMRFQVAINDDRDTTFTALDGKYSKIYSNPQGFLASHSYKTEQGFLNALKKVITSDSITKAWNEDGTPNTNFKL